MRNCSKLGPLYRCPEKNVFPFFPLVKDNKSCFHKSQLIFLVTSTKENKFS